jgi:hypothetical protein
MSDSLIKRITGKEFLDVEYTQSETKTKFYKHPSFYKSFDIPQFRESLTSPPPVIKPFPRTRPAITELKNAGIDVNVKNSVRYAGYEFDRSAVFQIQEQLGDEVRLHIYQSAFVNVDDFGTVQKQLNFQFKRVFKSLSRSKSGETTQLVEPFIRYDWIYKKPYAHTFKIIGTHKTFFVVAKDTPSAFKIMSDFINFNKKHLALFNSQGVYKNTRDKIRSVIKTSGEFELLGEELSALFNQQTIDEPYLDFLLNKVKGNTTVQLSVLDGTGERKLEEIAASIPMAEPVYYDLKDSGTVSQSPVSVERIHLGNKSSNVSALDAETRLGVEMVLTQNSDVGFGMMSNYQDHSSGFRGIALSSQRGNFAIHQIAGSFFYQDELLQFVKFKSNPSDFVKATEDLIKIIRSKHKQTTSTEVPVKVKKAKKVKPEPESDN